MKITHLTFALLATASLVGCRSLPPLEGSEVRTLVEGPLQERSPADVAVLPIENRTGKSGIPLAAMRSAFYEGLVHRFYSPLAIAYVDRGVVEASYSPGMFDEEAALVVYLTEWDDSAWDTRYRLSIAADVYLLDAAPGAQPRELWGGRVQKTISVDTDRARYGNDMDLKVLAARRFVDEVLGGLARRDPLAAPAPEPAGS